MTIEIKYKDETTDSFSSVVSVGVSRKRLVVKTKWETLKVKLQSIKDLTINNKKVNLEDVTETIKL